MSTKLPPRSPSVSSTSTGADDRIINRANLHLSPYKSNNMITIAQKSVSSANEILVGIENDLIDAKKIMQRRNLHNHNLEELISILKKENSELRVTYIYYCLYIFINNAHIIC